MRPVSGPSAQRRGPATATSSGNDPFEGQSQHVIADPSALTRPTGVMRDGVLTDSNRPQYLDPRRRGHSPIYRPPDSVPDGFVSHDPSRPATASSSPSAQRRGPATTTSSGNDPFGGQPQRPIAEPFALTRRGVMRYGVQYFTQRRRGHNPFSDVFDWEQLPEYRFVSEGLDWEQLPEYRRDPDGSDWGEPPEYRSDPSESSDVVHEERIWVGGLIGGWQAAVDLEVLDDQLDETPIETEGSDGGYDADVSSGFSEDEDLYGALQADGFTGGLSRPGTPLVTVVGHIINICGGGEESGLRNLIIDSHQGPYDA
ncbi:hypothetical protein N7535_002025 [Penicillium sp. DV-2018c]|nr:hypothetical protein N7461_004730 [Penicillium sp. DV-2018c]KAJ5583405.1 hypothetical protein N7535_002025 [Penicillium sp. DV-2018c]